jgi:lysophospholipase L1-like esterase
VVGAGIAGDASSAMLARVGRDVVSRKPAWVTVSCGVNDVWRDPRRGPLKRGVPLDKYKENMAAIVDKAQAAGIKVMILTATMVTEDLGAQQNKDLVGKWEIG